MRQAAGNNEKVPDAMPMAEALIKGKEDYPRRVENTTGSKPEKACRTEAFEKRVNGDQHRLQSHRKQKT